MTDRISLEKKQLSLVMLMHRTRVSMNYLRKKGDLLEEVQSSSVEKLPVDIEDLKMDTNDWGQINVRFIRPEGNVEKLPVIFYIHGAGWVFGSAKTHDKLIRENGCSYQIRS